MEFLAYHTYNDTQRKHSYTHTPTRLSLSPHTGHTNAQSHSTLHKPQPNGERSSAAPCAYPVGPCLLLTE
jgi:hypothetical protein